MDQYIQQVFTQQAAQAAGQVLQYQLQQSGGQLLQYQQMASGQSQAYSQQVSSRKPQRAPQQQPVGHLVQQSTALAGVVYCEQQLQQFATNQQSSATFMTTTDETAVERRSRRRRPAATAPQTTVPAPPSQMAPPLRSTVPAPPATETQDDCAQRAQVSPQSLLSRGLRRLRGNPSAGSSSNTLSSFVSDIKSSIMANRPGGRHRLAAAAEGWRSLRAFDRQLEEMLMSHSETICPKDYKYRRVKDGYLCYGGNHWVPDEEIEAFLDGLRPHGPYITWVPNAVQRWAGVNLDAIQPRA